MPAASIPIPLGKTGLTPLSGANRFIPFHRPDLIDMCLSDAPFSEPHRNAFKDFCRILEKHVSFRISPPAGNPQAMLCP
ncbi:MAG: hypothetical protein PVF20_05740, partial [Desulfobacterales bacterium]